MNGQLRRKITGWDFQKRKPANRPAHSNVPQDDRVVDRARQRPPAVGRDTHRDRRLGVAGEPPDGLPRRGIPEHEQAILSRRQELPAVVHDSKFSDIRCPQIKPLMPADWTLEAREAPDLLARRQVPQDQRVVRAARQRQPVAGQDMDIADQHVEKVAFHAVQQLPGFQIPVEDLAARAAGQGMPAVAADINPIYRQQMAGQPAQQRPGLDVVQPEGGILKTDQHAAAVRREGGFERYIVADVKAPYRPARLVIPEGQRRVAPRALLRGR